jgi:hypothetical protein
MADGGAIAGWADVIIFNKTEDPAMYRMDIIDVRHGADVVHHITASTIMLGMQRIIDLELPDPIPGNMVVTMSQIRAWIITSVRDGDATMIDDYCIDAIIQFALFNEQIYN